MQTVLLDTDEPLDQTTMGEKPHKLMVMKQTGIAIPPFFTVVTDGSLTLDDSVLEAWNRLEQTSTKGRGGTYQRKYARSAHPLEGGTHPFSGLFTSIPNIRTPEQLREAHTEIVRRAGIDYRVRKYISTYNIKGFNPADMNLLVMQQRTPIIHAMFLTSVVKGSKEMHIEYEKKGGRENAIYHTDRGLTLCHERGELKEALTEIGRLGKQIEERFEGTQIIEACYSKEHGVEILQSRSLVRLRPERRSYGTIETPENAPSINERNVFYEGFASGEGYFHLPVLVIDTPWNEIRAKWLKSIEYLPQVEEFLATHPRYIVAYKQPYHFIGDGERSRIDYEPLKVIIEGADVFIKINTRSLDHAGFTTIETGGVYVNIEETLDRFKHVTDKPSQPHEVYTGDWIHVLAKGGQVTMWKD